MTREEHEMRTLVRESDVIDRTDGSELAKAFNYLWEKYVEQEPKTGHWIMHEKHRECPKCRVWLPKDMPRNSFCPNCGACMKDCRTLDEFIEDSKESEVSDADSN